MSRKLSFLAGFGAGYVLGTRSGRDRYDQIVEKAQGVWRNPRVQDAAAQAQLLMQEKTGQARDLVQEKAGHAGQVVKDKVASAGASEDDGAEQAPVMGGRLP